MSKQIESWHADTDGEIDPQYQISLGQEWVAVGTRDGDGIEGVVALVHPKNARRIAALPDMEDALIKMTRELEHTYGGEQQMPDMERKYYNIAKAALAKAGGGQ